MSKSLGRDQQFVGRNREAGERASPRGPEQAGYAGKAAGDVGAIEKTATRAQAALETQRRRAPVSRPIGVRLNDLDITRSSEQTALIMSRLVGRGVETRGRTRGDTAEQKTGAEMWHAMRPSSAKPRLLAARSMLGYLQDAYCSGRIIERDRHEDIGDRQRANLERLWDSVPERFGRLRENPDPEWQLDFVVAPVDGIRDLLQGFDNGSVSVLAGGPPGCFRSSQLLDHPVSGVATYFFVVALNRNLCVDGDGLRSALTSPSGDSVSAVSLADVLQKHQVLPRLRTSLAKRGMQMTVSTMELDQPQCLRPALSREFGPRTFRGSSVAAACTVFLPHFGIDAFAAVVRRPQVILIATAARATNGILYAIPVTWHRRKGARYPDVMVEPGAPVHGVDDFVLDRDVFLTATGITETLLVHGVRFREPNKAATETLVLRSATESSRFITQHHSLAAKRFRRYGKSKLFDKVVAELGGTSVPV